MKKSISFEMTKASIEIEFNEYTTIKFDMESPKGFKVSNTSIIEYLKDEVVMINYTLNDGMMTFAKRTDKNPNSPLYGHLAVLTTFGPSQELIDLITPYTRGNNGTGQSKHYYSVEIEGVIDEIVDTLFDLID